MKMRGAERSAQRGGDARLCTSSGINLVVSLFSSPGEVGVGVYTNHDNISQETKV